MGSFFPLQSAFFQLIDQTNDQYGKKNAHGEEDGNVVNKKISENHYPWYHENNFDIEENEKHGGHVEFHAEPRLWLACRAQSTLVGSIFELVSFTALTKKMADENNAKCHTKSQEDLNENGEIIFDAFHIDLEKCTRPKGRQAQR